MRCGGGEGEDWGGGEEWVGDVSVVVCGLLGCYLLFLYLWF